MMPSNILRSATIAQLTRGGRSVVSRCNFSSSAKSNELRRPPRRGFVKKRFEKSKFDLFLQQFILGYCTFTGYEMIQMLEYLQTMERCIEKRDGIQESKGWPA